MALPFCGCFAGDNTDQTTVATSYVESKINTHASRSSDSDKVRKSRSRVNEYRDEEWDGTLGEHTRETQGNGTYGEVSRLTEGFTEDMKQSAGVYGESKADRFSKEKTTAGEAPRLHPSVVGPSGDEDSSLRQRRNERVTMDDISTLGDGLTASYNNPKKFAHGVHNYKPNLKGTKPGDGRGRPPHIITTQSGHNDEMRLSGEQPNLGLVMARQYTTPQSNRPHRQQGNAPTYMHNRRAFSPDDGGSAPSASMASFNNPHLGHFSMDGGSQRSAVPTMIATQSNATWPPTYGAIMSNLPIGSPHRIGQIQSPQAPIMSPSDIQQRHGVAHPRPPRGVHGRTDGREDGTPSRMLDRSEVRDGPPQLRSSRSNVSASTAGVTNEGLIPMSRPVRTNLQEILVPPGDMALKLKSSARGPVVDRIHLHTVSPALNVGDVIVSLDGVDITQIPGKKVVKLLDARKDQPTRRIVFEQGPGNERLQVHAMQKNLIAQHFARQQQKKEAALMRSPREENSSYPIPQHNFKITYPEPPIMENSTYHHPAQTNVNMTYPSPMHRENGNYRPHRHPKTRPDTIHVENGSYRSARGGTPTAAFISPRQENGSYRTPRNNMGYPETPRIVNGGYGGPPNQRGDLFNC